METLRDKLLKGCYTMQRWKKLLQSLQKVEPDSTLCNDWCDLSRNDFDHCTACYMVQWSVQLVSQRENCGKRNPTSTKGRSRWKSSSENYLLIAEVRFRVKFRFMVRVRDSKTIFHENYFWWMSNCVFQKLHHVTGKIAWTIAPCNRTLKRHEWVGKVVVLCILSAEFKFGNRRNTTMDNRNFKFLIIKSAWKLEQDPALDACHLTAVKCLRIKISFYKCTITTMFMQL